MLKYFLNFLLRTFNFQLLYRTQISIPYVLSYNFSYTQLSFVFLLQKDSYFDHDGSDVFFSSERF